MPPWLTRGLVLAAIHASAAVAMAWFAVRQPTDRTILTSIVFALLIGVALAWSSIDGWLRKPDRAKDWLIAAVIAGPTAGLLNVIGRAILVDQTGVQDLGGQLTSGAAFTALLVLVPALLGLLGGGRLDPPARDAPDPDAAEDRPTRRR
jgi:uncharacterized integral membrane protein